MSLGRVLICKESIRWAMIKKGRRNRKKVSACPHAFFFFFGEKSRQETFFVITLFYLICTVHVVTSQYLLSGTLSRIKITMQEFFLSLSCFTSKSLFFFKTFLTLPYSTLNFPQTSPHTRL